MPLSRYYGAHTTAWIGYLVVVRTVFENYKYRQIINRLKLGESQQTIEKAGPASRREIRQIFKISSQQGWLSSECCLPYLTMRCLLAILIK
jgi:hypothetical protein